MIQVILCDNCIHKDVCVYVCAYRGECSHHKTESAAKHVLRLLYADFMAEARKYASEAAGNAGRGSSEFTSIKRDRASFAKSKADRVMFYCRKIGFDPSADGNNNTKGDTQ